MCCLPGDSHYLWSSGNRNKNYGTLESQLEEEQRGTRPLLWHKAADFGRNEQIRGQEGPPVAPQATGSLWFRFPVALQICKYGGSWTETPTHSHAREAWVRKPLPPFL